MNKQLTLSTLTDELGQAATHKKEFLQQIDRIIPWDEWSGDRESNENARKVSSYARIDR